MNIGQRIKALRDERGLKRNELATKSYVTYRLLSDIENERVEPEKDILFRVLRTLRVKENWEPMPWIGDRVEIIQDIEETFYADNPEFGGLQISKRFNLKGKIAIVDYVFQFYTNPLRIKGNFIDEKALFRFTIDVSEEDVKVIE